MALLVGRADGVGPVCDGWPRHPLLEAPGVGGRLAPTGQGGTVGGGVGVPRAEEQGVLGRSALTRLD